MFASSRFRAKVFLNARMYDATDRRFMAVDLIGINLANPNTFNRFAYVWNNPVCLVDLFGLSPDWTQHWIYGVSIAVLSGNDARVISNVFINENTVYVDFFEALRAYGVFHTSITSGSYAVPAASRKYRATVSLIANEGSAMYKILPADPETEVVSGAYHYAYTSIPPVTYWFNLVTFDYFQKLMCQLGYQSTTSRPTSVNGFSYTFPVLASERVFTKEDLTKAGQFRMGGFTGHTDPVGRDAGDIFALEGTIVVAIVSGRMDFVSNSENRQAEIVIQGNDGFNYYYAHLMPHSPAEFGFQNGSKSQVSAGQPVGRIGDRAAAKGTDPHLHISARPRDCRNPACLSDKGNGCIKDNSDRHIGTWLHELMPKIV